MYLDNILRNPNRFIVNEEEVVNVEKARRVTVESIKHLARNTSFIQKIEKNGDHRIHIMSEDKKFNEVYPMLDTEVAVTPSDIREIIVKSKREASS